MEMIVLTVVLGSVHRGDADRVDRLQGL